MTEAKIDDRMLLKLHTVELTLSPKFLRVMLLLKPDKLQIFSSANRV